jgi:ATP/maltotriose-dependent transcriptional regulator MalT
MKANLFAWKNADFNNSSKNALIALKYLENDNEDYEDYLRVYNTLAQNYILQGNLTEAIKYSSLGEEIVIHSNGTVGNQDTFNLARARIYAAKGDLNKALEYINKGISKTKDDHIVSLPLFLMQAELRLKLGESKKIYDECAAKYEKVKKQFATENHDLLGRLLIIIANASFKSGNIKLAQEKIEQSLSILINIYGSDAKNRYLAMAYTIRGDIEEAQGNYKNALKDYKQAELIYNVIFTRVEVDDISLLYSKLAINCANLDDKYFVEHYFTLHKAHFGSTHPRSGKIASYMLEKGMKLPL